MFHRPQMSFLLGIIFFCSHFISLKSEIQFEDVKTSVSKIDNISLCASAVKTLCATWSKYERSQGMSVHANWAHMLERSARVGQWLTTYAQDDQFDSLDLWALHDVYALCVAIKQLCSADNGDQVYVSPAITQHMLLHSLTLLETTGELYGLSTDGSGKDKRRACAYALLGMARACDEFLQAQTMPDYSFSGKERVAAILGIFSFVSLVYHAFSQDKQPLIEPEKSKKRIFLEASIDHIKPRLDNIYYSYDSTVCRQGLELYAALLRTIFKQLPSDQAWTEFIASQRDESDNPCPFLTEGALWMLLQERPPTLEDGSYCESWVSYADYCLREDSDFFPNNFSLLKKRLNVLVEKLAECDWSEEKYSSSKRLNAVYKDYEGKMESIRKEFVFNLPLSRQLLLDATSPFRKKEIDIAEFSRNLKTVLETCSGDDSFSFDDLFDIGCQPPVPWGVVHMLVDRVIQDKVQDLSEYKECFKLLFEKCPGLFNEPRTDGKTPLHKAACAGHEQLVQLLLELEANVNLGMSEYDPTAKKHIAKGVSVLTMVNNVEYKHEQIKQFVQAKANKLIFPPAS